MPHSQFNEKKQRGPFQTELRDGQRFLSRTGRQATVRTLLLIALLSLALTLLLALSSCGGGANVKIGDLKLEPETVTVKAGETVTWKNEDKRSHQIMSGLPPVMTDEYMSPVLEPGESWSHTFEKPGEYAYHDMKVPGLVGWVNVEE